MSRHQSWTKVLQMKWNYDNKNSRWSAAAQIPGFNSLFFVLSKSVQLSQCEGRLQFPMVPWGYSHHTRGRRQSKSSSGWSLCRWKVPLLDEGMHDMRSRRERKQPGLSLTSSTPQRHSQVPNLSICGHLSNGWRAEVKEFTSFFFFLSRLSAFRRGQVSLWVGTGHMAPMWAVQSSDHSQTWSTSHGQSSV